MNNLLIVDDELEILEWLEELFRYEVDSDIEVYTVTSAFEALKLLNQMKFDVVLSDIKMPGMDGIKLHREIKKNWPNCRVVFLSAYRNFDYMYELCADNDHVQYVLKSEKDEVIVQAVKKAFREIDEMLQKKVEEDEQKFFMQKARENMRKDLLKQLIYPISGKRITKEELGEAGLALNPLYPVMTFLIRLDEEADEKKLALVKSLIENFSPQGIGYFNYMISEKYSLIMVQPEKKEQINWKRIFVVVYGAIEYALENFQKTTGKTFSAVISSGEIGITEVGNKIFRLRQLTAGSLGMESCVIAHEESFKIQEAEPDFEGNSAAERMKQNLKFLKREDFFRDLDVCCAKLAGYSSKHDMEALSLYFGMAVVILQFITEKKINEKLSFHIGLYKLLEIEEHKTWADAGQYLLELSENIFMLLGNSEEDEFYHRTMGRLLNYIDSHLGEDLTLVKLAEISGFNASYLSRLFKQVKDKTISEYILEKRMELAKGILKNTNEKIKDVAEKTGYLSANSFTRAFRNYMGISPLEYREHVKEQAF